MGHPPTNPDQSKCSEMKIAMEDKETTNVMQFKLQFTMYYQM